MNRDSRITLFIYLAAAVGLGAQEAATSATEDIYELEPFHVVGESYTFGAQKIISVSETQLLKLQPVDLEDLFASTPSVQVGGGLAAAEKIYVRGIEDKLLHVSIDGAPQGGYLSHHQGQFTIEPDLLKYVEVEPGPGGALQGPGALAGAIRFTTKGADDFLEPGQQAGLYSKASYYSNGQGKKATVAPFVQVMENFSFLAAYTWFDTDNYQDGNGDDVEYTAHTQQRVFLKGTGQLSDEAHALSLSYEWIEDEGTFRHRPNFVGAFNHPLAPNIPVDMVFERQTVVADYRQEVFGKAGLAAKLYYTDNYVDREKQYEMGYSSLGGNVHYTLFLAQDRHQLTMGADYRHDTLEFTGKGSITGFARTLTYQTIPDETVDIFGAYIEDKWQVLEQLDLAVGARLDHYVYEDKDAQEFEATGISPFAGVSYTVIEGLDLNASYGWAFRGPTIIDAITANEGGIENAEEIDPEVATNAELGLSWKQGPFNFTATIYQQEVKDVIVNRSKADPTKRGNGGDLEVFGYDLALGYFQHGISASIAVSFADPELDDEPLEDTDFGLGTSYGRQWVGTVGYQFPDWPLQVGWTVQYAEEYEAKSSLADKAAYAVHGLHASWQPLENLSLQVTARNIFDRAYVDQTTSGYNGQLKRVAGLPAAGRDLRFSLSYQF